MKTKYYYLDPSYLAPRGTKTGVDLIAEVQRIVTDGTVNFNDLLTDAADDSAAADAGIQENELYRTGDVLKIRQT